MKAVIAAYARSPFHFARKGALAEVRPDTLAAQVGRRPAAAHRSRPGADRGRDPRLCLPRGARRATTWRASSACSPACRRGGRHDGQPLLRLVDAGGAHRGRADRGRHGRSLPVRRRRVDDDGAAGRLQLLAQPRTAGEHRRLHLDGRDGRERGAALEREPRATRSRWPCSRTRRPPRRASRAGWPTRSSPSAADGDVVDADGCIRPATSLEALAGLQARVPARRRGHGRHLVAADRRRRRGAGHERRLRGASTVCSRWRAIRSFATVGRRSGHHGHRPDPGHAQGPGARRARPWPTSTWSRSTRPSRRRRWPASATWGSTRRRVNLDGGGIAIGHPLGATGARITGKAASLLVRERGRYALATQCIGGGQGIATVLERV